MLDPVGFWSYAQQDDANGDGQLSQLRAIVGWRIVLQCGVKVSLWQVLAAIPHGADWAETVERAIGQTTFFIPIVTPRFLRSLYCRDEFASFRRRMRAMGRNDLIFPIHYVDVDGTRPEETVFGDDLDALRRSPSFDFRPLFTADPKSQEVWRWAGELAESVLMALQQPTAATARERAPWRAARRATAAERNEKTPPAAQAAASAPPPPAADPPRPNLARDAPAPGRASRKRLLVAGVVALVGVAAASLGLIATHGPSGLATQPTQTPPTVASASPSPTLAAAISATPSPGPTPVAVASPSATSTPTPAASPVKSGVCDGSGASLASLASRTPGVLSAAEECALKPRDVFRECTDCPAMVVLPPGSFTMGSPASESGRFDDEGPQHDVRMAKQLAVGEFQVTVDEFKAFVTATDYEAGSTCYVWNGASWEWRFARDWRDPGFAQTGSHPAACLNWDDAQAYAKWLSGRTGKAYRLLSEAEWEYAARGRTEPGNYPRYFFDDSEAEFCKYGNGADKTAQKQIPAPKGWPVLPCSDGYAYTSPVGSFRPNAFGLYDMHGNVWQWVEDCYRRSYSGAPQDGGAWTEEKCDARVVRGGSWNDGPRLLRAAYRKSYDPDDRDDTVGFRLARTLTP